MKTANFREGYTYNKSHRTGVRDLGNKGPQPTADADKSSRQALSLQGTVPAGWSHYEYAGHGASGFGRSKKG